MPHHRTSLTFINSPVFQPSAANQGTLQSLVIVGRWPKSQEVFPDVTNTATHCLQRSGVPSQTTLDLAFGLAHSESRYESSSSSLDSRGVHESSVYSPLWLLELLALLLLSVVMGHHRLCMTSVTSAAIALQSVAPDFALCVFSSIRGSRTGAPEAFGASFATIFVFSCAQKRGQSPFHESTTVGPLGCRHSCQHTAPASGPS